MKLSHQPTLQTGSTRQTYLTQAREKHVEPKSHYAHCRTVRLYHTHAFPCEVVTYIHWNTRIFRVLIGGLIHQCSFHRGPEGFVLACCGPVCLSLAAVRTGAWVRPAHLNTTLITPREILAANIQQYITSSCNKLPSSRPRRRYSITTARFWSLSSRLVIHNLHAKWDYLSRWLNFRPRWEGVVNFLRMQIRRKLLELWIGTWERGRRDVKTLVGLPT